MKLERTPSFCKVCPSRGSLELVSAFLEAYLGTSATTPKPISSLQRRDLSDNARLMLCARSMGARQPAEVTLGDENLEFDGASRRV